MMAKCAEFESLRVRDEEVQDLELLLRDCCPLDIKDSLTSREGKVQVLLQVRTFTSSVSLSDSRRKHIQCVRSRGVLNGYFTLHRLVLMGVHTNGHGVSHFRRASCACGHSPDAPFVVGSAVRCIHWHAAHRFLWHGQGG